MRIYKNLRKAVSMYANGYNIDTIRSVIDVGTWSDKIIIRLSKNKNMCIFRKIKIQHAFKNNISPSKVIDMMNLRTSVGYRMFFGNRKNVEKLIKYGSNHDTVESFNDKIHLPKFIFMNIPELKLCINSKKKIYILTKINDGAKLTDILGVGISVDLVENTLKESCIDNYNTRVDRKLISESIKTENRKTRMQNLLQLQTGTKLMHITQFREYVDEIIKESKNI